MTEIQFLGYLVPALVTLAGLIAVIVKFTQPINDLRVVIQKLNDNIDALKTDNTRQSKKIEKHDEQIDKLGNRVEKLETRVDMYHKEGKSS